MFAFSAASSAWPRSNDNNNTLRSGTSVSIASKHRSLVAVGGFKVVMFDNGFDSGVTAGQFQLPT